MDATSSSDTLATSHEAIGVRPFTRIQTRARRAPAAVAAIKDATEAAFSTRSITGTEFLSAEHVTSAPGLAVDVGEAIAAGVGVPRTVRESSGTGSTHAAGFPPGQSQVGDQGGECSTSQDTSHVAHGHTPPYFLIAHRFAEVFKPVCH